MSLEAHLESIIQEADHSEIYGLNLRNDTPARKNVLEKFIKANKGDLEAARKQLLKTLVWRKEFCPLDAMREEHKSDFEKIGVLSKSPSGRVVTWNLYGAVKDKETVFSDLDAFIRWRIGLMERGITLLDFESPNCDQMDQVHDYMSVSFLKLDKDTKSASKAIIKIFQDYYPELLHQKYFVNVPHIVSWVMTVMKAFMSKETTDKFHVLSDGKSLVYDLGEWIPMVYGGEAEDLDSIACKPQVRIPEHGISALAKGGHSFPGVGPIRSPSSGNPTKKDNGETISDDWDVD